MIKNFKIIISLFFIITVINSCKRDTVKLKVTSKNNLDIRFFINSVIDGNASYLYVENNNDTIYGYIHYKNVKTYPKVLASKEVLEQIKKVVLYHLDIKNFQTNQNKLNNRNKVVFFIESSKNRFLISNSNIIKSEILGVKKTKDVSLQYFVLIKRIKQQYREFKNWQ